MISLPIDAYLGEIIHSVKTHRGVVVVAPPGAGKTTRVPAALVRAQVLSSAHPALVLLQPRRVAARASAERIAREQGWSLGEEVGYHIRFEKRYGPQTRIRVLTEGILTRQLLDDPFLEGVGAVILDEFHERSLHTDLALALLREVRETVREDLAIIVMSATMDPAAVSQFLSNAPIHHVEGRSFPVRVRHKPTARPASSEAIESAVREALDCEGDDHEAGDLLVFLPGAEEIRRAETALRRQPGWDDLLVLPFHGGLSSEDQRRVLAPSPRRKIILSTNLAETSLTIDGVRTVIDSGLARVASVDLGRGLDRLELQRISRASAAQRAGRAGRTAEGVCIRLWSEREERGMPESDTPEIHRVELSTAILTLHAWGHPEPRRFPWYEPPREESIDSAEELLRGLGALTSDGRITAMGRQLLSIPVHPRLGRLLVEAASAGYLHEGASLAALISEKDIVLRQGADTPRIAADRGSSDLLTRLDWLAWAERARFVPSALRARGLDPFAVRRVIQVRNDLIRTGRRIRGARAGDTQTGPAPEDLMLRWVLLAYPDRVVRRRGAELTGVMVGGRGVRLASESVVRDSEFFVVVDPRDERRTGAREARARIASAIQLEWLSEAFPDSVRQERLVTFDPEQERLVGLLRLSYRNLVLREDRNQTVSRGEAGEALAEYLRPRARDFLAKDESIAAWLARITFLREAMPESPTLLLDDATLAELVAEACAGKRSLAEVRASDLLGRLKGRLTYAQTTWLEEQAPEALRVPSGSRIRLEYQPGRPPVLAVRIQEIFGWTETPRLAGGRVPVLLHLLGPNYRPVQVTGDLKSFWSTTYFQVRKDLRARYPKHSWPEDPLNAKPEAKGSRRT